MSGDIGATQSLPLFYDKDDSTNITFIANGIGDNSKDIILKIDIDNSLVNFTPIPLSTTKTNKIEYYNLSYWEKHYKQTNNKSIVKRFSDKLYKIFNVK